jgi:serine protease Do
MRRASFAVLAGLAVPLAVLSSVLSSACKNPRGGPGGAAGASSELPPGAVPVASSSPPPAFSQKPEGVVPPVSPGPVLAGQAAPLSFAPIARRADASVVTINTIGEEVEASPFFSGRARRRETKGLGTGFIVDKDGIVLTNNHVIEGAGSIAVKLSDDREFPAKVVGRDATTDIAALRIDTKDLVALALGDSDVIEVGDWVVAIGNPFGLSHTVSAGIISAKGRSREDVPLDPAGYYNFLQTDASINPGNSGGPLLSLKGEVVGVNTAIRGNGAQGIGFAIPINMVKQLLPMLLRDGHVTRSALGIKIQDVHELAPEDRAALKRPDEKGTLIEYVTPGGPADRAGLAPGDVILAFDGQPIDRGSHLQWLASTAGVGKTIGVRVARDGKLFDIKVTLGLLPERATGAGTGRVVPEGR